MIIWSAFELVGLYFLVPESYLPVLLRQRAQQLREETGDDRYYAPIEKSDKSITRTILWSCTRPFQLMALEPMLTCLCVFTAILLGILYLFFRSFPKTFSQLHGFTASEVGLTFLGLLVGMIVGVCSDPIWRRIYINLCKRTEGPRPEYRLPSGLVGSILVPIGLFWFAGTSSASIHPVVPILGSTVFGTGTLLVFSSVFTYVVEAYPVYAASAMAANSFVRSCFAAAFPLFADAMYNKLGFAGAGCLLGGICLIMPPGMWFFFKYGDRLRARSRFTH